MSEVLSPIEKKYFILMNMVRYHDSRYYVKDDPELLDKEYDQLYATLEAVEQEIGWTDPDSPTQRVGGHAATQFKKIKHLSPMYSLGKVKTAEEFITWDKKMIELLKNAS